MNGSFTPSSESRSATLVWVKPPGIEDGEADAVGLGRLHAIDELVFGVALKGDQLVAELVGGDLRALFDGGQRVRSVNFGLALPQQVQVRPVE